MKLLLLCSLFQVLLLGLFAKAQVPHQMPGTICYAEAVWCQAPVVGMPGRKCGCPTPAGYIEGTLEGRTELMGGASKPNVNVTCKTTLLRHYGFQSIGNDNYGRVEKDNSITLLKQNGKTTTVQVNGGCNSGNQKMGKLLKERIQNLDKAYSAALSMPANQRFSEKLETLKNTLDVCKLEEANSDWYKEAMMGAQSEKSKSSSEKKTAVQ